MPSENFNGSIPKPTPVSTVEVYHTKLGCRVMECRSETEHLVLLAVEDTPLYLEQKSTERNWR